VAYLAALYLEARNHVPSQNEPMFHWVVHHVKEVFLSCLPRKFLLDGSSTVTIECGPRRDEPKYEQVTGTTAYFVDHFDFAELYRLGPRERDERVLQVLQDALLDIAARGGGGDETRDAILKAATETRSRDFAAAFPSRKLSRATPGRELKVQVTRNLGRDVGEAWSCEIVRRDGRVVHKAWIGKVHNYVNLTTVYRSSEWDGRVFRVRDQLGHVEYELDVSPFLV
jgi:hypothetical protein